MHYLTVLWIRPLTWVSLGQSQGVSKAAVHLEALGKTLFPCLFQLPEATAFLGSMPLPPSSR